jgi:L,D-transpeptidase YcbB
MPNDLIPDQFEMQGRRIPLRCDFSAGRACRTVAIAVIAVSLLLLASGTAAFAGEPGIPPPDAPDADVSQLLRNRLEAAAATGRLTAAGAPIYSRLALPSFYLERGHALAWLDAGETATTAARELVAVLREAYRDGLEPSDYHLAEIDSLLAADPAPDAMHHHRVDLDLLLTDAFVTYGSHLLQGRVDPERLNAEWLANRRGADLAAALRDALAGDGVRETLAGLRPARLEYRHLCGALARLREIEAQGGWQAIPAGPTLRVGDQGPRVALLRQRLRASVDYATVAEVVNGDADGGPVAVDDHFTEALASAVKHAQWRHGLTVDGIVGPETLAELNVPLASRISQVRVNQERWRWLPQDLGRRHIRVNVAGFVTELWQDDQVVLELLSVVGTQYRQTPSFSGRLTYLVFSPMWHVPPGIAVRDQLPRIQRDPVGYLAGQRMTLLEIATNQPVDPAEVDWEALADHDFNRLYRLRQEPGPHNALGAVKFMFPNRYNVYIHDTPARDLFLRDKRDFSSGCIRIERPLELAESLLRDDPRWPRAAIEAAAQLGRETTVVLREPVPVHLLWWTAWADVEGRIHFRRDIYRRDGQVWAGLQEPPPRY